MPEQSSSYSFGRPPGVGPSDSSTSEVYARDGQLLAYLTRKFPGERDLEDAVQESYLRLWRARVAVPVNSVSAFLLRVARNVVLDRYRRRLTRREAELGTSRTENIIDEGADVVETVSTHEKELLLATALATLPSRAHEVVVLCKLKGLSHGEAARRLGISKRTVDEHLRRGMKRLGEELRRRDLEGHFHP